MEQRACGTTGLSISTLGLGCWMFGGAAGDYWGAHEQKDADALVAAALERGVTYFDTAEMYNDGRSEESLGRALRAAPGGRARAVIGSKVIPEHCEAGDLRRRCEASLRRLGVEAIDLYVIHWPIRQFPVDAAFETLEALRREGKIRVAGVSNFGVADLSEALATGVNLGIDQLFYNLLSRAVESRIVPFLERKRIGLMAYLPLMQGLLTGKYRSLDSVPANRLRLRHFRPGRHPASRHGGPGAEDEVLATLEQIRELAHELGVPMSQLAIAWLLHKPAVTCVLAGARDTAQLEANIQGANLALDSESVRRLDEATAPLLRLLGDDPDYWSPPEASRIR